MSLNKPDQSISIQFTFFTDNTAGMSGREKQPNPSKKRKFVKAIGKNEKSTGFSPSISMPLLSENL